MGVKIVLAEREPIGLALRRFRELLEWNGVTYEMRRTRWYYKGSEIRHRKEIHRLFEASRATLLAKRAGEQ